MRLETNRKEDLKLIWREVVQKTIIFMKERRVQREARQHNLEICKKKLCADPKLGMVEEEHR